MEHHCNNQHGEAKKLILHVLYRVSTSQPDNNLFNKIQNILIVNKFNVAPLNGLFGVLFLFHLEDVLNSIARTLQQKVTN